MLKKSKKLLIALFTISLIASCNEVDEVEDGNNEHENIFAGTVRERIESREDLSSLVEVLRSNGMLASLGGNGPFTLFAPTNEAFQDLIDNNNQWNSLEDIDQPILENLLKFHLTEGSIKSTDLSNTYVKSFAAGPGFRQISIQVEVGDTVEFNGDSTPVTVDLNSSNGVVHTIDKVMLPPNIVTLALNNPNFSSLITALTDERHTTDFVSVLSAFEPFTIFAPTNKAFQALLDSNDNWNSISDISIETLEAVLKYHVSSQSNGYVSTDLESGTKSTLNGSIELIAQNNKIQLQTTSNQTVNVIMGNETFNIQGTNGVIHSIDSVLIP